MYQHDKVRGDKVCPNCAEAKPIGNLLCWPCHHSQKQMNDGDYSKRCKARIAARDITLGGPLDQVRGA